MSRLLRNPLKTLVLTTSSGKSSKVKDLVRLQPYIFFSYGLMTGLLQAFRLGDAEASLDFLSTLPAADALLCAALKTQLLDSKLIAVPSFSVLP
jgi:hypothetical protein